MNLDDINWPELGPESHAMMAAAAARQYNRIASKLGAKPVDVPPSVFDPKPSLARYRLRTASEVILTQPIRWRVKGIIPEKGIGAIYGPSGSAKTFLALDMAIGIAQGAEWFGYRVRRCPVVYVCLEGEAGLSVRLGAYSTKGTIPRNIHFLDQPLNLLDSKDVVDLTTAIRGREATQGLVVIDTLNRAAPGLDENSSVDMGKAISAVKMIQQAVGGLVLLVHHTGKDAAKGMRGHSSLYAALDAAIEVRRSGDLREWSVAKAKDGADGMAHAFRLDVVALGVDEDGDPVTSCVIQAATGATARQSKPLTAAQQIGMETFMAAAFANRSEGERAVRASIEQWREEFYLRL
jgi:putative DNA primase/helicase